MVQVRFRAKQRLKGADLSGKSTSQFFNPSHPLPLFGLYTSKIAGMSPSKLTDDQMASQDISKIFLLTSH